MSTLNKHGFSDNYLKRNLISFTSDGASALVEKSGVAKRLSELYPNIAIWHCLNHRLELSIAEAADEVSGIQHFCSFMDKLDSLYSQSHQKMQENWKNMQKL